MSTVTHIKAAHYAMVIQAAIAPELAANAERRNAYAFRTINAWVIDDHTIGLTASGDASTADACCTIAVDHAFCALEGSPYDMPLEQGYISSWHNGMITYSW
jgi:hypothetical protein